MASLQVYQNHVVHKRLNSEFSSDLQNIVKQIKSGGAFRWKTTAETSLDDIFRDILVEREFTFYAGYDFYMGTRLNLLKDKPSKKDAENSAPTSKKEKNLFMLPGMPDPIPLTAAFMTNWRSNQASVKNEKIFASYGMRPSAHPGRASKETLSKEEANSKIVYLSKRAEQFLALFDQIRFWGNREWKYFPAFFTLAFLALGRRDLQFLYALFQSKNIREYRKVIAKRRSRFTEVCTKITNLSNCWDFRKDSESQTPLPQEQGDLMREYISMLAFLALLDAIDDDEAIIENILLLDDISGMCTALLGTDIMRQTLRRWEQLGKPAENPLSPQKVTFKNALRKVCAQSFSEESSNGISSNRLVQSFSYTDLHMLNQDNPVREKAELAKSKCYVDVVGTAREQYTDLLHCDITDLDKLDQITLCQFEYFKRFGGDFHSNSLDSDQKKNFKKGQADDKRQTLEYYFIFRKELEEKGNLDFQKVIQAYTTLLEDMQQKFFATFKKDKRIVRIIKNLLENVSHHSSEPIEEIIKKRAPVRLTRKNINRIFSYRSLRWTWVRYFIIRRMQNKEIPVILYSFCDSIGCNKCNEKCKVDKIKSATCPHKDAFEYRFIESIKVCYPVHLWPEPDYDKSNVKI